MGQSFPSSLSRHIMLKFLLLSLSVLCVSSAPAFNDYLDYLPGSLKEFVEDTWEDGTEVLGDLQENVEKMIQQQVNNFRTSMLSMTKDWRAWHRNFYNSSELIVPATDIINKAAKDMKADIADLF